MATRKQITKNRDRRKARARAQIRGTAHKPRLSVFRSNKTLYVQLIDDDAGKTLLGSSTKTLAKKGKPQELAQKLGEELAKKAKDAGVSSVVFDKGPYKYHGRVKAVAEGARSGGLKF